MHETQGAVPFPQPLARFAAARHGTICVALCCAAVFAASADAWGVTPDSPEVRKVIDKAFAFLDGNNHDKLGGQCLIALAYVKDGKDESHPAVARAVKSCQTFAKGNPLPAINENVYSIGIATIFLCALNPSKYNIEIAHFLKSLDMGQKPCGGWGYGPPHVHGPAQLGDTSMTQYGVLCNWEAKQAGFSINLSVCEKVANWLMRTQDPEGNWAYQGHLPEGSSTKLIPQTDFSNGGAKHGVAAAGLGSMYMISDVLQLIDRKPLRDELLPEALDAVPEKRKRLTEKVDIKSVNGALTKGNQWILKNYRIDPPVFTNYYLYALERYQSFKELADGDAKKEPKWYNDGFNFLKKSQLDNGSWKSAQVVVEGMEVPDTAFGILFLLRSTKKSIEHSRPIPVGALVAGRGLPGSVEKVHVHRGRIMAKISDQELSKLLDELEKPESTQRADLLADPDRLFQLVQNAADAERPKHLARLRTLISNSSADVRDLAIRTTSRLRDLDAAPALMGALQDPDWRIVRAAQEGLLFISRSAKDDGLGEEPDEQARAKAMRRWRHWLGEVRPDLAQTVD